MKSSLIFVINNIFIFVFKFLKYNKNYFYNANANKLILNQKSDNFEIINQKNWTPKNIKNFSEISISELEKLKELENFYFKVDINKICSDTGKKIFDKKFPLFATSIQIIEKNFHLHFKNCKLYKYLINHNPKNYAEVFNLNKNNKVLTSLSKHSNFYPWIHSLPQRHLYPGLFGIKNDIFVEFIFLRLQSLIKSIIEYSFLPKKNDVIMGYLLNKKNDYRFVITSGTHRTSVILALYSKNLISLDNFFMKFDNIRIKKQFHIINCDNIDHWPAVKKQYITKMEAINQFNSYFL